LTTADNPCRGRQAAPVLLGTRRGHRRNHDRHRRRRDPDNRPHPQGHRPAGHQRDPRRVQAGFPGSRIQAAPAGAGEAYAPSVRAHSETVLRSFYDLHRDMGTGPVINPFPLDRSRRGGRAHAHHNPMGAVPQCHVRSGSTAHRQVDPHLPARAVVQRPRGLVGERLGFGVSPATAHR